MKTHNSTQRSTSLWCLFLFSLLSIISYSQRSEKYYRIVITAEPQSIQLLREEGLEADHFHFENGKATAEVSHSDLKLLQQHFPVTIKIRNLEKRIPKRNQRTDRKYARKNGTADVNKASAPATPENFNLGSTGGFFTLKEAMDQLDAMRTRYPNLISAKSTIGTSIQNRPIYSVRISDNPDVDEDEEEVLFTALHHAREPMGLSQMIFYMWHVLENYDKDPEIKRLIDNSELYFVPVINPDGYVFNQENNPNGGGFWRKNRRRNANRSFGVDLNRNYDFEWSGPGGSSTNPNSDTYRGTFGFSEPETKALEKFCNQHKFIAALNYHSFGNLLIHPWGYTGSSLTPDNATFVRMGNYMTEENNYKVGNPTQTVGYTGRGSSDDWMYGEQSTKNKMLSMSPEVGAGSDGFYPASSRIIPLCKEAFPLNLKLTQMIALYAKVEPVTPTITTETTTGTIDYQIQRFSIQPAAWTIRLTSNSPYFEETFQKNEHSPALLGTANDDLSFQLSGSTPSGSVIPVEIVVDNGKWSYTETVTITYTGNAPTVECTLPDTLEANQITENSVTLTWSQTQASSYTLRYRSEGISAWAERTSDTTSLALDDLEPNTTYEVQIQSVCEDSTSDYGKQITFRTKASPSGITYCDAIGRRFSEEYISKVEIDGFENTSEGNGYSDFTTQVIPLIKGKSISLTITPTWAGQRYAEGYAAWIDWDGDGTFGSTERIFSQNATTQTAVSGQFEVPSTLASGTATRMRIAMKYNAIPSACETFTYGEVEDYTVRVSAGSAAKSGLENSSVFIYPNPATTTLSIQGSSSEVQEYVIYTAQGIRVGNGIRTTDSKIDISHLASGWYTLRLFEAGTYRNLPFVINRK